MTEKATILTQDDVIFTLDVTTNESHSRTLKATSNPIESGAMISDHAILQPTKLTITGVMVDVNPVQTSGAGQNRPYAGLSNPDFINGVSIPGTLESITEQTVNYVSRTIDLVAASASTLLDGLSVSSEQRALAPWLPTLFPAGAVDLSEGQLRIAQAYDQLFAIQKSALPVTVATSSAIYSSMLITSIKLDISEIQWDYAKFTLDFQEVILVDTQSTGMTNSQNAQLIGNTGGRTTAQTAQSRNAGEVTLSSAKPVEVLSGGSRL
jgi:hypothetical protein